MSKKVLITGITGFVGSHLANYIADNLSWELYGLTRSFRSRAVQMKPSTVKKMKLFCCDISDPYSVGTLFRDHSFDYIFHLAAQSYVKESLINPMRTFDSNIRGTFNLLSYIQPHSPIVVIASSAEVYGKTTKDYLTETDPYHMASPYSLSKIATDLIGRYYHEAYGVNILVSRMFTHTGPRRSEVFAESSFAYQIACIEKNLQDPVLHVGNLHAIRTWLDVRDAVRAYVLLATENPQFGEVYNIAGDFTCTLLHVVETLLSMTKVKIEIEIDPSLLRRIDADKQVPDISKFTEHTGWGPTIPFEQTMRDLLDFWRARV